MSTYQEKLKDPRWQKKRLEILSRDNFQCQLCGSTTKTLHVHHRRYLNNSDPWGYEDNLLSTLCEDCHSKEHQELEPSEFQPDNMSDREVSISMLTTEMSELLGPELYELNSLFQNLKYFSRNRLNTLKTINAFLCPKKEEKLGS